MGATAAGGTGLRFRGSKRVLYGDKAGAAGPLVRAALVSLTRNGGRVARNRLIVACWGAGVAVSAGQVRDLAFRCNQLLEVLGCPLAVSCQQGDVVLG